MQVHPSYVLCKFIQEVGEVCEAIASSLQSCMKTQIVVSVEGFQVLGSSWAIPAQISQSP